jgi:hypothetical protein
MSTRGPRGRFLALEPAQAGFKQLEIAVTNVFVAMFSGSLRVSPNVRMNRAMRPKMGLIGPDSMPLGILAQASRRVNRRKRPRVIRLPWRDVHMVVLSLLTPKLKFRLFLEAAFPAPRNKSSTEFGPDRRRPLERLSAE